MTTIKTKPLSKEFKEASWPPSKEPGESSRGFFVCRDGEFIEAGGIPKVSARGQSAAVIQDTMDAITHPCDPFGAPIDSKSRFRQITKANGCEEVGNERIKTEPRLKGMSEADYVDSVRKAINDCRYGNSGLSEYERHRCREIDRRRNNHG